MRANDIVERQYRPWLGGSDAAGVDGERARGRGRLHRDGRDAEQHQRLLVRVVLDVKVILTPP